MAKQTRSTRGRKAKVKTMKRRKAKANAKVNATTMKKPQRRTRLGLMKRKRITRKVKKWSGDGGMFDWQKKKQEIISLNQQRENIRNDYYKTHKAYKILLKKLEDNVRNYRWDGETVLSYYANVEKEDTKIEKFDEIHTRLLNDLDADLLFLKKNSWNDYIKRKKARDTLDQTDPVGKESTIQETSAQEDAAPGPVKYDIASPGPSEEDYQLFDPTKNEHDGYDLLDPNDTYNDNNGYDYFGEEREEE